MLNRYDENTVYLTGTITKPKQLHKNICVFAIAQVSQAGSQYEKTHYIDIVLKNIGKAELANWGFRDLRQGDEVRVQGHIEQRKTDRSETSTQIIVARNFKIISTKETRALMREIMTDRRSTNTPNNQNTEADDALDDFLNGTHGTQDAAKTQAATPQSSSKTQADDALHDWGKLPQSAASGDQKVISSIGSFQINSDQA